MALPPAGAVLSRGDRVDGRYVIDGVIAEGGMGAVYRAIDERLARTVAMKVLLPELVDDATCVARFEREALAAARLSHPGIVQVFDFGTDPARGLRYLVMEHILGRTLTQAIQREGRLPPTRAAEIVEEALHAIDAAHAQGIVHRDLKPGNLMLVSLGRGGREVVKVLDFGIAQLKTSAAYSRLTMTGMIVGTPAFMAPEQARGERSDVRTDVYAMGMVLWCALTAQRPYAGRDPAALVEATLFEVPTRADRVFADIAPAIAAVADRALQKDPLARFSSAAHFVEALMEARGAGPLASAAARAAATLAEPTAATVAQRRPAGSGAAAGSFARPDRADASRGGTVTTAASLPTAEAANVAPKADAAADPRAPAPAPLTPGSRGAQGAPSGITTPVATDGALSPSGSGRWLVFALGAAIAGFLVLAVLAIGAFFVLQGYVPVLGSVVPADPNAPVLPLPGRLPTPSPTLGSSPVPPSSAATSGTSEPCERAVACCHALEAALGTRGERPCEDVVGMSGGEPARCESQLRLWASSGRTHGYVLAECE